MKLFIVLLIFSINSIQENEKEDFGKKLEEFEKSFQVTLKKQTHSQLMATMKALKKQHDDLLKKFTALTGCVIDRANRQNTTPEIYLIPKINILIAKSTVQK